MTPTEPGGTGTSSGSDEPRAAPTVLRPRTIGAMGPVDPVVTTGPPLEALADPTWQPGPRAALATAPVPALPPMKEEPEPEPPDPDIWTITPTGEVPVAAPTEPVAGPVAEPEPAAEALDPGPAVPARSATAGSSGTSGLLRSNLIVASGTAVSRLTGFARTFLILYLLYEGLSDAFTTANNTPNMIYELILGGILTASLVPLFTDDLERGDGQEATSAIISVALVTLVVVTLVGLVAGPAIILLLSTGSPASSRDAYLDAAIPLALIFAPQIFFYGLMAVWSAVLNARRRFLAAAWAPVLNNLIAIATLLYAGHLVRERLRSQDQLAGAGDNPIYSLQAALDQPRILWVLGIGSTLGIAVMALSLYPALRRSGFRLRFKVRMKHPAVQRALRLSAWTLGYVVANQIAVIVISILAEPSSGGTSRYTSAFQFFQLPHALLAVSIMVTFEPMLGRLDSRGDLTAFNDQLLLGFRLIGLLIIPAAVGYIALPTGLDSRTFEPSGVVGLALSLGGIIAAFSIGLPGFSTYLFALRGFYAKKNTKIPFFINCAENAINIVLAVIFVRLWGVVGLALAFAAAYSVSAVIAVVVLNRHSPGFDWRGLVRTWALLLVAAAIMGGFVYGVVSLLAPDSPLMLAVAVVAGISVGIITYFAAIYALKVPGISELMTRLPGLRRFA